MAYCSYGLLEVWPVMVMACYSYGLLWLWPVVGVALWGGVSVVMLTYVILDMWNYEAV